MNQQSIDAFWLAPIEGVTKFSVPFEEWTNQDFIRTIRTWPVLSIVLDQRGEQVYLTKLRKFFRTHSLWLEYSLVEMNASKREELRVDLQINERGVGKTTADLSIAIRELCRQVHGKSELLTQALSFEHLWFLAEYSNCLQLMKHSGLLTGVPTATRHRTVFCVDDVREHNHSGIRFYEQALEDMHLETEELLPEEDWREHFLNILIAESVKTAIDNKDKNLKQHCLQFLNAFRVYETGLEYSNNPMWLLINGQLLSSVPGAKPIKLPPTEIRRSRGRPIGSQNKKKRLCLERVYK